MKIEFIGATHEVTGSMTLITVNGRYLLVDCGMEQGRNVFENVELPVNPSMVDCVLLTHAHIDHSGNLPLLYKRGFRGQVYATKLTSNLCHIMLLDAAHIQESDAEWQTRKAQRAGREAVEPVYTTEDAMGVLRQFRPCNYNERLPIMEGVSISFTDIGHLLGSSAIELWLNEGETERKLVFSGDVGNTNQPLLKDPQRVAEADYLVIESTYGDRDHPERPDYVAEFTRAIQETFDRGGNLVIPSFAVGRTQEILYFVREIKNAGLVHGHDGFKVYVDSPLANEATSIFLQCDKEDFDAETAALMEKGVNPLWFEGLELSISTDDSKLINTIKEPKIIVSASGMCDAGRIRHHLKHNLWREDSTVLFVGYQAEGTLGRQILDGAEEVKLFGESIAVNCEIRFLNGVSGHADRGGLVAWLENFAKKPELVFVNHGDDRAMESFCQLITERGYKATAPYSGTSYDLVSGEAIELISGVPYVKPTVVSGKAKKSRKYYEQLLSAVRRLSGIARDAEGLANNELQKFTEQVNKLCERFK